LCLKTLWTADNAYFPPNNFLLKTTSPHQQKQNTCWTLFVFFRGCNDHESVRNVSFIDFPSFYSFSKYSTMYKNIPSLKAVSFHFSKTKNFSHNICWGSPFLLAMIVLVVIVGFPLFGPHRQNGCCTLSMFKHVFKQDPLDNTWKRWLSHHKNYWLYIIASKAHAADLLLPLLWLVHTQTLFLEAIDLGYIRFSKKRLRRRCCDLFYGFPQKWMIVSWKNWLVVYSFFKDNVCGGDVGISFTIYFIEKYGKS